MKKKCLKDIIVLIGLIFVSAEAFAQFYDSDDKILFYQCVLLNGEVNEASTKNNAYVFNFDGQKATTFGFNSASSIRNLLRNNRNYYEGRVYGATYNVKYRSDLSNSSWTVYSRGSSGYGSSWTDYWYFSKDRKTMIHKESSSRNERTYKLVDKSYFVEEGRSRSNMQDGVIYE